MIEGYSMVHYRLWLFWIICGVWNGHVGRWVGLECFRV